MPDFVVDVFQRMLSIGLCSTLKTTVGGLAESWESRLLCRAAVGAVLGGGPYVDLIKVWPAGQCCACFLIDCGAAYRGKEANGNYSTG